MSKEQQHKYPWHLAPDWAMWGATDEDGSEYFYEKVPYIQGAYWKKEIGSLAVFFITPNPEPIDWQNSLEKRPGT
jgi:hypothetical protein